MRLRSSCLILCLLGFIVGDDEADVNQNKLSYYSSSSFPSARVLIGKEVGLVGLEVELQLPAGSVYYLIEKVEHI